MIANFFSKTKPVNTLAIVTLLVLIYLLSSIINFDEDLTISFFLRRTSFFVLLLVVLFMVNFIIRKNSLTKDNSYTLLIFVILIGMFPFTVLNFKLVGINFLLLLSYRRIYSLRTQKDIKEKLFDSSLWIGIASILYPWCSILILLVFFAAYVFGKWTWRNALIPIIGFSTPLLIYLAYLVFTDVPFLMATVLDFEMHLDFANYNVFKLLIPLAIIISLLLWAIIPTTFKIIAVNNEFRSSWQLLIIHFFLLVFVIIPWPEKNGSELLFLFFPMAIIFTNYLQLVEERWFKEVFLFCLLFLTIGVYFL